MIIVLFDVPLTVMNTSMKHEHRTSGGDVHIGFVLMVRVVPRTMMVVLVLPPWESESK